MKIDGKLIAKEIIAGLKERGAPTQILAAVLIGDDPQSESFLKQKEKTAKELGVDFRIYKLSQALGTDGLRKEVGKIAKQKRVGGIIVQLPLPEGINSRYVLNAIPAKKDVDVLSEHKGGVLETPGVEVVKEIAKRQKIDFKRSKVVIVGAGKLIGAPLMVSLEGKCADLKIIRSTSDRSPLKTADLIISGVGKAGIIDPKELKNGAGVIDFGYSYENGLSGDLKMDDEASLNKLSFYTPTPGGTGPILVTKLFENFYKLCGQL